MTGPELQLGGEKYIMRSLMMFILHRILFGLSNRK